MLCKGQLAKLSVSSLRASWVCIALLVSFVILTGTALADCITPKNAIEAENCLPGTPQSTWDISAVGDTTIQGFATDISVNVGQTVTFKIDTTAAAYTIDIYRLGYYGGNGARKVATINPTGVQNQPNCLTDAATNLADCGNWAVSASWAVPANAVSGIYIARPRRTDNGGASHIVFIVRNDASHSDVLFQTSDTTWHAYNGYGGHSLYGTTGNYDLPNRAKKISYNRPFWTRSFEPQSWLFNAEYPMVRWLEANGYDVSYFTGVDAARNGALITNHKIYMSTGHDEYWSGPQRVNVEAARDAAVNLAFFSGNEVFWKTRWENSIDGSGTQFRTMACYKETLDNAKTDPQDPPTWTGTWRDPRFSPPADGGRPENSLTGTSFIANGPGSDNNGLSIKVPAADGKMRFWRNTNIATQSAGATVTLPAATLGFEWDIDPDNGFRPAGLFHLSTATYQLTSDYLLDYGGTFGAGSATHNLAMYRAASGALVFGAGTVQWSWGLDNHHDANTFTAPAPDVRMQQATVNLFADMGVQPATLQTGLVAASKSTDTIAPTSTITSPASGTTVAGGSSVTIAGTASDVGGVVGGVEVSTDAKSTWHPATGRGTWSYTFTAPSSATLTIYSRAVDDSGNIEVPTSSITLTAGSGGGGGGGGTACTSCIWPNLPLPTSVNVFDGTALELGVKFRSDVSGTINAIRFYKGTQDTGTHTGHLWTSAGTLLGTVTFSAETASGWQQANFSTPIAITAGTTYVASYFSSTSYHSEDAGYFTGKGQDTVPLHALASGVDGLNGVYRSGTSSGFPSSSFADTNYWVDVVFAQSGSTSPVLSTSPASLSFTATVGSANPAQQNISISNAGSGTLSWTASDNQTWISLSAASGTAPSTLGVTVNISGLAVGSYSGTVTVTSAGTTGSPATIPVQLTITSTGGGACTGCIWPTAPTPVAVNVFDGTAVELGVKFRSDVAGSITGLRFYKGSQDTGTHTGHLWSSTGTLLGSVTFSGETASGWQQANFTTPVSIIAGTTYVASYFSPTSYHSESAGYFTGKGQDTPPLHALASGVDGGNGVYHSGTSSAFPNSTYQDTNYWVDVVLGSTQTFSISGIISGTGGNGATVNLGGASSGSTTADASGNYTFTGLSNASYTVTPTKSGFVFSPGSQNVTVSGSNVTAVNFSSAQTFSITGTVSGTGGNGTTLTLSGASAATATADASGNYTFNGLVNGSYTVTPSKSGVTFTPASQPVTISGANATAVNFATVTFSISGTLSGTGGNGASVALTGASNATTTADASGNYTFSGLLNGSYTVRPSKTGFIFTPASQNVTVNSANLTAINFNSAPTFSISGTIGGSGASGTTLTLSGASSATTTADASGNYTFNGLVDGSYVVTPSKSGLTFTPASQNVTVSGANVTAVNFTAAGATFSISGTISGAGGNLATVSLTGAATSSTTADASGNYSFTGLTNGSYAVTPSKAGFVFTPAAQNVTVSGANLTAVNFTSAAQTFTIGGAISGTGGNAATVTLSGTSAATVTANASGVYSFSGLANGSYTVTPSKAGYTFTPISQNVIISGANASGVDFSSNGTAGTGLAVDITTFRDRSTNGSTIVSPALTTSSTNELLLAFVSTSGANATVTVTGVTGAGLTWALVRRTNTQRGTAEIWRAFAQNIVSNATVTASLSRSTSASITVVSFTGADITGANGSGAIGAVGGANGVAAPSASIITTRANSFVFGVGNDWDSATARTLGTNQSMVHQFLASSADTFWVQRQIPTAQPAGTTVTINDTAPTADRFNLSVVEILPAP